MLETKDKQWKTEKETINRTLPTEKRLLQKIKASLNLPTKRNRFLKVLTNLKLQTLNLKLRIFRLNENR
jgi:hypothetical protein